jgi:integrase
MRTGDNPAAWRGCQEYRFPRAKKINSNHYAALPYSQIPSLMRALVVRQYHSVSAMALEFLILTGARSGEVLNMKFEEIDWDQRVWSLEGIRTKQGRPHQVPLCDRAMEILQFRRKPRIGPVGSHVYGCKSEVYVFVGYKKTPLSTKAMHHTLKAMGISTTVHGFRASFRTWAAEETNFDPVTCELALGHSAGSPVELSYRRGTELAKRRKLMEAWASYCHGNSLPKAEVARNLGDEPR